MTHLLETHHMLNITEEEAQQRLEACYSLLLELAMTSRDSELYGEVISNSPGIAATPQTCTS